MLPRMPVGDGGLMPGMTVATHLTRVAPAGEPGQCPTAGRSPSADNDRGGAKDRDPGLSPRDDGWSGWYPQALITTAVVPGVEIPGFRRGMTGDGWGVLHLHHHSARRSITMMVVAVAPTTDENTLR
jgi:hypothetical protein